MGAASAFHVANPPGIVIPIQQSGQALVGNNLSRLFIVPAQPRSALESLNNTKLMDVFEKRLAASECKLEKISSNNTLIAAYVPFTFYWGENEHGGPTYAHILKYATHEGAIPLTPERMRMAMDHEGNHVFELEDVIDAWATRYNMGSLYCLEAEERVLYALISEVNAFGHEGLLTTIRVLNNPERRQLLELFETASEGN